MARSRLAGQVGRVVGGRYRLLAPLGSGASADVFVADDVTLRRRVAVKVLHDALAGDEGFLKRFRAEARAVASLRHPNIMAVLDWGEEEDGPFLVLEYLGGGSLRDLLDRGHRLSASQALVVGLETARGLDHAHRRGLVHRDIKPANLLFDDEGRLAIADFGIARALAEATWTEPVGAVVGTVRYASPEQARGRSLDGRADVYALALVLIEAVTGWVPFSADTTIATLMARLERPIPVPVELGPLADTLAQAGALDPAERLDAAALARAFDAAARQLPPPARLPLAPVAHLPLPEHERLDRTTSFAPVGRPGPSRPRPDDTTVVALVDPPVSVGAPGGPGGPDPAGGASGPSAPGGATQLAPPRGPAGVAVGGAGPASGATRAPSAMAAPAGPPAADPAPAGGPAPPAPGGRRSRRARAGRRHRRWPWILAAVVLIAGAAAAIFGPTLVPPSYAVPNLVGQPAAAVLAHPPVHFRVVENPVRETGPPRQQVLRQNPPAALRRHGGTVIVVDVSVGNKLVVVPDLKSVPTAQALSQLQNLKLVAGQPDHAYDPQIPAGTILDWSPKGSAAEGDTVSLRVSDGPEFVTMPDLVTQPTVAAQAESTLVGLGIAKDHLAESQDYSDTVPEGDVIATTPTAGAPADRAATVALVISKGPQLVTVPNVMFTSLGGAVARLQSLGFQVQVYGPHSGSIVVFQSPTGGTSVRKGASVTLDSI